VLKGMNPVLLLIINLCKNPSEISSIHPWLIIINSFFV